MFLGQTSRASAAFTIGVSIEVASYEVGCDIAYLKVADALYPPCNQLGSALAPLARFLPIDEVLLGEFFGANAVNRRLASSE